MQLRSSRTGIAPVLAPVLVLVVTAGPAAGQAIDTYLPAFVTGQDEAPGVTVLSRQRPGYDPLGLTVGGGLLNADLTETIGENTNITGYANGRGSPFLDTHATANYLFGSPVNHIRADASVDYADYIDATAQNFTNWTATLQAAHALGTGVAALAYSHLSLNEIASDFGALQADSPVPYQVDDVRGNYTVNLGRTTLQPLIDYQHYTYGDAFLLGTPVSLTNQTRDVMKVGAELRYPLSEHSALVTVGEAIDNSYEHHAPAQPSETSTSGRALVGLDTTQRGLLRIRLLLGAEIRTYQSPVYASHVEPIAEGSLIWTPNGQTTASLSLLRTIEDPADNGVEGYTITKGSVVVDREMRRNLLAQASVSYQLADPLQTGRRQTNVLLGASLTRFLNRRLRIVLSDTLDVQHGADQSLSAGDGFPSVTRGGDFTRDIIQLAIKLSL